jgi:hypothetical protein
MLVKKSVPKLFSLFWNGFFIITNANHGLKNAVRRTLKLKTKSEKLKMRTGNREKW